MMAFFDIYKQLCRQSGFSPNAVAKELHISSGTVTKWKNGSMPSAEKLRAIAEHFHVTTDYLLTGADGPLGEDGIPPVTFDDFTYAMFHEGRELTEENKRMLLDMARLLRERQHREGKDKPAGG
ncbi:helix-turn-helix domain-containing protein [Ethanoligenens harbinense]|uniref:Helix-turn-helix domain protein n=1 Tax=Ethanoligenens harbinense (strain DSM 18485 / JCM 12961 / CGMCC 1.5033 / YUAN-3) TaxID=663278 RepID=E6U563_ETHHY|nr:helix-turn-helix transcriptional regulator [Ethanoligenens harbinense]ADU27876.1 helix-turn-helix domain protein [Ethanoligenens harbinense YUAN-3]AVQ96906.1 XRE family transcriptional regulator [Ethanoligenens harbinense YUAN-3]AYF39567.1 XRE family transcriptional regulator [Ethanoligenens harbinense]AYF42393.1 XRE family transcriptional regulator [Ethanoligenens harbinense]QCN93146.1 XRE family transcriptional regulator [Ethanoligenens harbinense]